MYKLETIERTYSKAEIAKLQMIGRELKESKKDSNFRIALKQFIRETTSK